MRTLGLLAGAALGLMGIWSCGMRESGASDRSGKVGMGVLASETRPTSGSAMVAVNGIRVAMQDDGNVTVTRNGVDISQDGKDRKAVTGSGVVKSEKRPVSGFSAVELDGIGTVVITQNGREALTVRAEDNLLPLLRTRIVKGTLHLETAPHTNLHPTKPIEFLVNVRELTSLSLLGSGDVQANQISGKALTISLAGSGKMTVSGQETNLNLDLSGSGKVMLSGQATRLGVDLSGSGQCVGDGLKAQEATVNLSGSGAVVVHADRKLTVDLSGSGQIEYLGSPQVQKDITGSGAVRPR